MKRSISILLAFFVSTSGCGMYGAWSKRREARALERSIEKQREKLEGMSPDALAQAEAESREKAIAQYEKILEEYADVGRGEMDEALYLLGRLLFEREQQAFQRQQQSFESLVAQAESAGLAPPEEPRPRYPAAKAVYERLLQEFGDSTLREDALYDLAYIHYEEGDRAKAAGLFQTLVREKPRSRYAPEVHFRLGEHAFDSFELAEAESQYRSVLRHGKTELTEKALFKLGWVYYNLDRFADAKNVLADLLSRETRKVEQEGREFAPAPILFFPGPRRAVLKNIEPKGSDLYQETLEIIARVFSESGGADALVQFIRSQQKGRGVAPYAAPLMHRLALVETERSQFDAAARAYQLLLDTFPTFRDAPRIELEYVQVLIDQKQLERAASVRERMLERYDSGSPWARANPEQEIREEALRAARKGLAWAIRYYHSKGLAEQKESGGIPASLRQAIVLYEKYLERFPEGKAGYEKRFRHAQALFAAGEFSRAVEAFRSVSFDTAFDQRREEAAFARILSVEKLAGDQPSPLPRPVIESMVAAYEDYLSLNPESEKNASLLFKEGQLYFAAEDYPPAIAAFTRLIELRPADPLAAEAHDLIAQSHFRLGEFAVAERWAEQALAAASPGNALGARRQEVENLFALTMFQQGEKADEEGQHEEATRHYQRLVDRLPRSETAPRALYNAAVAIETSGGPAEAAKLFERLLAEYVDSDLAPDAAVRLAAYYETQPGGSEAIVRIYERVADFHVNSPQAQEFLFFAGKLAVKQTRGPETVRLFEKFLSRYAGASAGAGSSSEQTLIALYHLGVTYASQGNRALARANLEQFLSRPRPAEATFGDSGEGYAYASANAHLLIGKMIEDEYASVRITPPVRENLKRKESLLETVVDRFAVPVSSGLSPLATEASFRIGEAYEEFARSLEESPKPPGLSEEERAEYDQLLEQQLRPYLVKAVAAYRVTVRASREKSIADEWVTRCRERLAAVAPRVFLRSPRPGYLALPRRADPPPPLLRTFAGAPIAPGSAPGFFGSLLASDTEVRRGAFAEGLAASLESPPDWTKAAERFSETASGGPPEAGYNAAIAHLWLGRTTDALRVLEELGRAFPTYHPAVGLTAAVYERSGKPDLAANYYRRAAESPEATIGERVAFARFLERSGREPEALAVYQAATAADPASGEAALGVARLGGETSATELDRLIGPLSQSAPLLVDLGILAAERDAPRVAARAFGAARALLPSTDPKALAIVLNDEALAAQESGDIGRAESLLATALELDGSAPAIANTAGILRMRRGDFESAESEFRKAIEAAPDLGTPWANLGILNELYFGMPETAVECYTRYLATRPADEAVVAGWIREIREGTGDRSA